MWGPPAALPSLGNLIGTRLAFSRGMEFEKVLAAELGRLVVLADQAARRIAAKRPWWSGAVAFLRKAVR